MDFTAWGEAVGVLSREKLRHLTPGRVCEGAGAEARAQGGASGMCAAGRAEVTEWLDMDFGVTSARPVVVKEESGDSGPHFLSLSTGPSNSSAAH